LLPYNQVRSSCAEYTLLSQRWGHARRDKKRDKMSPQPLPTSFGAWVRTRRRQLDLTQAELGALAGCSAAAIRKIEAEERKPSRDLAALLARALRIPAPDQPRFLQAARGSMEDLREPASTGSGTPPTNLPALLTSTVDRTRDHAAVSALLKDETVRLVTLIGSPGIGKTRLSLLCGAEALPDFPDGVWFVDLAEINQAEFFTAAVARSIHGLDLPPSPGLAQLSGALRQRRLLLILDNFEHILEPAAVQAADLLKTCPNLKILATSRAPLRLYAEHEYWLPPLSIPPRGEALPPGRLMEYESVQLFVARARQHHTGFAVNPRNAQAVAEIAAVLEGIPLAIELAAAALRRIPLEEMAVLLRGRDWIAHLSTPARDLPPRQRTLENVIAWSYDRLDGEQREFFSRLGVLCGRFDPDAAAALSAIPRERALDLLDALAGQSLLLREHAGWRMLEVIREFAASRLDQREVVEQAHARYFFTRMRDLRRAAPHPVWEDYFQANVLNFHCALARCAASGQAELGFHLAFELEEAWSALGYFREGLAFLRQLLDLPAGVDAAVRANAMRAASDLAWQQHDFESALIFARQAVELGQAHGLVGEHPHYLNRLGRIYIEQGNYAAAREAIGEALALARQPHSTLSPGSPLVQLGEIALFEGEIDQARDLLEQALGQLPPADGVFRAIAATDLAEVMLARGELELARHWLSEALPLATGHIRRFIIFLGALGGYLVLSPGADLPAAARLYGAVNDLTWRSGVVLGEFYRRMNQARLQACRAKLPPAEWAGAFEAGRGWDKAQAARQAANLLGLPAGKGF